MIIPFGAPFRKDKKESKSHEVENVYALDAISSVFKSAQTHLLQFDQLNNFIILKRTKFQRRKLRGHTSSIVAFDPARVSFKICCRFR